MSPRQRTGREEICPTDTSNSNAPYSSPGSTIERPPEMKQILTEDSEPMLNPGSFCPFSYVFSISLLITSPPGRAVASLMTIAVSSSLRDNNKNSPTSTTTRDDNCNGHQLDSNGERN